MSTSGITTSHDQSDTAERVTARLRVLRDDHPDAAVSTDLTRLDDVQAVVRAEIVLAGGGSASAYGVSSAGHTHAVEEAENRALNRALAALGYIATDLQPSRVQSEDVALSVQLEVSSPEESSAGKSDIQPGQIEPRESESLASARDEPNGVEADPPLEDYSWTAFWRWARQHGYQNKAAVEEIIGQSITSLSPAQVRKVLLAKAGTE